MRGARGASHVQQRALGNQRRRHEAVVLVAGLRQLEALGGRERHLLRVRGSAAGHTRQREARCCAYPRKRAGAAARSTAPVLVGRAEGARSARHSVRVCDGRAALRRVPASAQGASARGAPSCSTARPAAAASPRPPPWRLERGRAVNACHGAPAPPRRARTEPLRHAFRRLHGQQRRRHCAPQHARPPPNASAAEVAEHCLRCGKPPCLAGMHGAEGCAAAARTRVGAHALFMGSVTAKFSCTLCVRSSFFTVCRWISAAAVVSTPCCRPAMAPA